MLGSYMRVFTVFDIGSGLKPGGGTPLNQPHRYAPPQRVVFLRRFGLKTVYSLSDCVCRIPDSLSCIPDSKSWDSSFHKFEVREGMVWSGFRGDFLPLWNNCKCWKET